MNDNEVWTALTRAERDPAAPGHDPARRIVRRQHFRLLYKANAVDLQRNDDAGLVIYQAAKKEFGDTLVRYVSWTEAKKEAVDFPVRWHDGRILSARLLSEPLRQLPRAEIHAIFIEPELQEQGRLWLTANRDNLLGSE